MNSHSFNSKPEARTEKSMTESETTVLLEKITEIESRIEVYKTEIIEKETLIERLRILNSSNEQDLERLKRELRNKQVECDGYIGEIQVLNQKLAELDIELNHRNSRVLKLEGFLEDERKDREVQIKNVRSSFEIDVTYLKRELESKILECNGYIKEIEELNQEIFRLKGMMRPEQEVDARYTTSYIMPPKGVTVTREVVVPQQSATTESAQSSTFGHTEFMVDVKEKAVPLEVSSYQMNPKRMVKVKSPFETRANQTSTASGSSTGSTTTSTTKITRIQTGMTPIQRYQVDEDSDKPAITVVSNNGASDNTPPGSPFKIRHLESSSSPKLNVSFDPAYQSITPTTLNATDTRSHTSTFSSSTVMTKITQLQTSALYAPSSGSENPQGSLEFRVVSPINGIEASPEKLEEKSQNVISQVEGSSGPIRVRVEAEEKLEFEPMQVTTEVKPLQTTSSRFQTFKTHYTTSGEGGDSSSQGRTNETVTRTKKVQEIKEQRVEFKRGSSGSSRSKDSSKTSTL